MKSYVYKLTNGMALYAGANPDIILQPSWSARWTAVEFEKQFPGRKFKGPGMYITHAGSKRSQAVDSLLVIPDKRVLHPWKQKWSPRTKFAFYCYHNHDLSSTINHLVHAPVRQDDRE